MFTFLLLCACVCSVPAYVHSASGSGRLLSTRARCPKPEVIPNGDYRLKRNNNVMRIMCRSGYFIQGPRLIDCVRGKWYGEKPVCAKEGCTTKPPNPTNGLVQFENKLKATLFCNESHKLAGNRYTYCNGTSWDRQIGSCRENKNAIEYECDFETEDLCGWAYEAQTATGRLEWRRVMAANMFTSFVTGPRHDHTHIHQASGGHYMLMESLGSNGDEKISLMSPIYSQALSLKTTCCFRFYYFMYGASVGTLDVFVRPVTTSLEQIMEQEEMYIKFSKVGSQNNLWNEAMFDIDEMPSDFQIVFVASSGKTHLSDIAIDDVKLMTGSECKNDLSTDRNLLEPEDMDVTSTTEATLYDIQSCVSRCDEKTPLGFGIVYRDEKMFGLCDCHFGCEESGSCCPDYRAICLDLMDETSTFEENIANEEMSTTIAAAAVINTNKGKNESSTATTKKNPILNRITITTPITSTAKATALATTTLQFPTTNIKTTSAKSTPATTITNKTTTIKNTTTRKYTSVTTVKTTTTQTTFFADIKHDKGKQRKEQPNTKQQPGTIKPVKKIPAKEQQHKKHQGANILQILFILLGVVLLLGTTWLRCKYRLKKSLQFRGQPKDTELLPDAHTPSAILAEKFKPTTSADPMAFIENGVSPIVCSNDSSATNNDNRNAANRTTNLATKRDTTCSNTNKKKERAPLLWEDDNASENEDNYAGIALQLKHSTNL